MPSLDLSNYVGREQAYVKHCLLKNYLSGWGYIVGSKWDSLVFIDGFAGPWGATDENYSDASFGIAQQVLSIVVNGLKERHQKKIRAICLFVETKPVPFAKLNLFATAKSTPEVQLVALRGRFIENIAAINTHVATAGGNPFKFVFLDQKGWAATPMNKLKPFLQGRSCEVLFNLMTSFLTRFVAVESREQSYEELFGRPGVLEIIRGLPKGTGEREEAAVREYCKSLRDICGFQYVSQAVVLEPSKEKIRYYMLFATNSPRGVEVFKKAEMETAETQDDVRRETNIRKTRQEEMFFDGDLSKSRLTRDLRQRYTELARNKVMTILTQSISDVFEYDELYCEAMAFPLVTPSDFESWLQDFQPHVEIHLSDPRRRKAGPAKSDRVIVVNRGELR